MAILPIDGGRYGTPEMTAIFGSQKKVDYQLHLEGAVALSQAQIGMIPKDAGTEIHRAAHSGKITSKRVAKLEKNSDHDTAALVEALSETCAVTARPWVHYGLTSNDLVDTSNSMQMRDALCIITTKITTLAQSLAGLASKYSKVPAVGRTHGQHASIISFGLKFANWAAEMVAHLERIQEMKKRVLECKTLGVVGTGSLMGVKALQVQKRTAIHLGLYPVMVATQVVPRERYAEYIFALSLVAATLEKMAIEIRNLQRTEIGEVAEQFKKGQMGSSAVPVKRNPIKSERVTSLARLVRSQVAVSLENIPLWHERDLSNSANERFLIPTSSILTDEMLATMCRIIDGLTINEEKIRSNLDVTKGQIYAEFVLEALISKDVPRMEAYRAVQHTAFKANDSGVSYIDAIRSDPAFTSRLDNAEIDSIFVPEKHLGASLNIIKNVVKLVAKKAVNPSS